ncbi:MAG: hypothetical protein LBI72_15250 [Flavobacteriaceae bacterium]|jgi:Ca2+/Na+ antiporter|nr:hypothetical protein [Flavobacteriaceae bacterium]
MNVWRVVGRVLFRTVLGCVPFILTYVMIQGSYGMGSKFVMAYFCCFFLLLLTFMYGRFISKNGSPANADKEERLVDKVGFVIYLVMFFLTYQFILSPEMQ